MATLVEEFEILIASKGGPEKLAADIEKEWGRGFFRYPGSHPLPKIPRFAWTQAELDYIDSMLEQMVTRLGKSKYGIMLKMYRRAQLKNPDL